MAYDPEGMQKFFESLDALADSAALKAARKVLPRPVWSLTSSNVVKELRTKFSEMDLTVALHRGMSVLDAVDANDSEWDVVDEAVDLIWLALEVEEEDED